MANVGFSCCVRWMTWAIGSVFTSGSSCPKRARLPASAVVTATAVHAIRRCACGRMSSSLQKRRTPTQGRLTAQSSVDCPTDPRFEIPNHESGAGTHSYDRRPSVAFLKAVSSHERAECTLTANGPAQRSDHLRKRRYTRLRRGRLPVRGLTRGRVTREVHRLSRRWDRRIDAGAAAADRRLPGYACATDRWRPFPAYTPPRRPLSQLST